MSLIKKYTTKNRTFKFSPCGRYITVYINGRMNGMIWNNNKVVMIDGEPVVSSEFFK